MYVAAESGWCADRVDGHFEDWPGWSSAMARSAWLRTATAAGAVAVHAAAIVDPALHQYLST